MTNFIDLSVTWTKRFRAFRGGQLALPASAASASPGLSVRGVLATDKRFAFLGAPTEPGHLLSLRAGSAAP